MTHVVVHAMQIWNMQPKLPREDRFDIPHSVIQTHTQLASESSTSEIVICTLKSNLHSNVIRSNVMVCFFIHFLFRFGAMCLLACC